MFFTISMISIPFWFGLIKHVQLFTAKKFKKFKVHLVDFRDLKLELFIKSLI